MKASEKGWKQRRTLPLVEVEAHKAKVGRALEVVGTAAAAVADRAIFFPVLFPS